MSNRLLWRTSSIILGDKLFAGFGYGPNGLEEGIGFDFEVVRTAKPEPNTCELNIRNLSRETRAGLQNGTRVVLNVGYRDSLTAVFVGEVRTWAAAFDDVTLVTHIVVGDGDAAYSEKAVSVSLSKGTSAADAVEKLAAAMGVDPGNAKERLAGADLPPEARSLPRGYVASGKASTEMTKLVERFGLSYSFQDGKLQVLAPREVVPGQAVLLRRDAGLLGSPEPNDSKENKGPATTTLRSLLQPDIRPGTLVQVESEFVNGLFRAEAVKHTGDTHGDDWVTEIEALPL